MKVAADIGGRFPDQSAVQSSALFFSSEPRKASSMVVISLETSGSGINADVRKNCRIFSRERRAEGSERENTRRESNFPK